MRKTHETGAIMIEILAVLALIGVMGPMLYNQILSRNQEISNVNMASEMRAIKEAMSSVIAADGAVLGEACGASGDGYTRCTGSEDTFRGSVSAFLPVGMIDATGGIDDLYDVSLWGYQAQVSSGETRTFVFGVVSSTEEDQPLEWNFKRAARVASLIGSDGGIVSPDDGKLVGTNGTWELALPGFGSNAVVATTALDSFDPDLGITDPYAVAVPESLAFNRLHAWNYFSVGQAAEGQTGNCFELLSRTLDNAGAGGIAQSDTIDNVGTNGCDPLFWVGSKGDDSTDKSTAGHVYVKNNLYIGRDNSGEMHAVALRSGTGSTNESGSAFANDADRNAERGIAVYDIDGKETLTIDAQGRLIAKQYGDDDAEVFAQTDDGTNVRYGIDPANTSVLNDVRLAARGGARLSDILPTYIAKGMQSISSGTTNGFSTSVTKPTCPTGYAAAVIVTPLKWGQVDAITIPAKTVSGVSLSVSGSSATGSINIPAVNLTPSNMAKNYLAISVSGGSGAGNQIAADNTTASWTVTMGYKESPSASGWESVSLTSGEIQALAQTYCVYVGEDTIPEDRLTTGE